MKLRYPGRSALVDLRWAVAVTSFVHSVPAAPGASLPAGWVVVGVGVDASYHGDEPYDSTYVNFGVVDARGVVVWPTTDTGSTAGCEAGPVMTLPVFVPPGYSTGAGKILCYTVPEAAVASLRFTAFFDDPDDPAGFLAVQ